jgi:hypothetical protein
VEVTLLHPDKYDSVIVTVAHPHGDLDVALVDWIRLGPGPRALVRIVSARRRTGEIVPLDDIPLEFHNSRESRDLQRDGLLPTPWGPPETQPDG